LSNGNGPEMIVSSLGSGSNGNAFLVEFGACRILIDAGIPIRTLIKCLSSRGVTADSITAALVSHEHSDHVRALPSLLRRNRFPIFATRGTIAGLEPTVASQAVEIRGLESFSLDDVQITPIPVAHDAREPVGFFVEAGEVTLTIMTDLGEVHEVNAEFASRADHLIIESNYDVKMLRTGPYPEYLKRRIRSTNGHLSNVECAGFLADIVNERTGSIWLSHLSENNNRPDIALETATEVLARKGHARQITPLPRYDGTVVTWRSSEARDIIHQSSLPF
jgi:phosphoribosyl 1,2-cyclic phosphodiesterase